jgi:hypothetical protein
MSVIQKNMNEAIISVTYQNIDIINTKFISNVDFD